MITVENIKTYSDKYCSSCHSHNDTVKAIVISGTEWQGLSFSLCDKCREEMINKLSESDGWGKLLEVR